MIFYSKEILKKYTNLDFGFSFTAERLQITNELNFKNIEFQNLQGKWILERKTSHNLSTFRVIKTLTKEELAELENNGHLIIVDKNPESRKLTSFYRIKYIDNYGAEFPLCEIKIAAITGGM